MRHDDGERQAVLGDIMSHDSMRLIPNQQLQVDHTRAPDLPEYSTSSAYFNALPFKSLRQHWLAVGSKYC
jgi:hypothetical protein